MAWEDSGTVLQKADLLNNAGGQYTLLPNSEIEDMVEIVLPTGMLVTVTAEMKIHNGALNQKGGDEPDFISASRVVQIK